MKNRLLHYLLKDKNNYYKDEELSNDWEIFEFYLSHVRQMSWILIKKKFLYFIQYKKIYIFKLLLIFSIFIGGIFFGGKFLLENNPFIEIKKTVADTIVENIYCPDTINVEQYLERLSRISGKNKEYILARTNIIVVFTEDSTKTSDKWLKALGYIESKNRIDAEKGQYWGEWQLGTKARQDAGFGEWSKSDFLNNRDVQMVATKIYTKKNYEAIKPYIKKYNNRILKTYHLTESGMLAMAHNCGVGEFIKFLNSGGTYIPVDGNGVKSTNYLTLGNYNIKDILGE
jgi:hypothetical protein